MNSLGERIRKPRWGWFSVIVLDPGGKLLQDGEGVRAGLDAGIIALEGFDECLADAVALRTAHRGKAGDEVEGGRDVKRVAGGEGGAIVGQPLHGMGRPQDPEAGLDTGEHQVAHHLAADAAGTGLPGDDLPVMVSMAKAMRTTSPFQQPPPARWRTSAGWTPGR